MGQISAQWKTVFLEHCDLLTKAHVTKFSGLNPSISADYQIFARALGITPAGQDYIEEKASEESDPDYFLDGLSDDQETEENGETKGEKKWRNPMKGLEDLTIDVRANIYLRWLEQQRTLLTFPLVTQKRAIYLDLNCLLCHVNQNFLSRPNDQVAMWAQGTEVTGVKEAKGTRSTNRVDPKMSIQMAMRNQRDVDAITSFAVCLIPFFKPDKHLNQATISSPKQYIDLIMQNRALRAMAWYLKQVQYKISKTMSATFDEMVLDILSPQEG